MKIIKPKVLILAALFAALTAVGAFIKIPLPFVPITLQFLFVAFSGILLGPLHGMLSQLVYIGIGLAGVPVFTHGGGIAYVFQPTFGYLMGFVFASYTIGKVFEKLETVNFKNIFISVLCGMFVIYLFGLPYLYVIYSLYLGAPKAIGWVFYYGFAIFLAGDLVSAVVVSLISVRVIPGIRKFM